MQTLGKAIEDGFHWTAQPGANATLLPESSVLVGRSHAAYKRDGWLELQERVTEEAAAAWVWLYGVKTFSKAFKKGKTRLAPQYNHLSSDIAWNPLKKQAASLELTAQEMFARNRREMGTLLKIKSVRWLVSVGAALGLVAYAIPKLNQMKTNMIIRHLSRRKRQTEGSNVQFGDPASGTASWRGVRWPWATLTPNGFGLGSPAVGSPSLSGSRYATPGYLSTRSNFQQHPNFQSQSLPGRLSPQSFSTVYPTQSPGNRGKQPTFAGLDPGALLQGLGHAVEQTPWGSILAVDFGIAGGRAAVASQRSYFETLEVIVRDIGSLYFYILCAPHLMKAASWLLDKRLGTQLQMSPKVGGWMLEKLSAETGDASLSSQGIARLSRAFNGEASTALLGQKNELAKTFRQAPRVAFENLLTLEAPVYLGNADATKALAALKAHWPAAPAQLLPEQVQSLLNAAQSGARPFEVLSAGARDNLAIAIKQAYRHSVGLSTSETAWAELRKTLLQAASPSERAGLAARFERMGLLDGLDQTHSMLRRSLNVARGAAMPGPALRETLSQGEALADWLDAALNRRLPFREMVTRETREIRHTLGALAKGNGKFAQHLRKTLPGFDKHWVNEDAASFRQLESRLQSIFPASAIEKVLAWLPWKTPYMKGRALIQRVADFNRLLGPAGEGPIAATLESRLHALMDELAAKTPAGAEKTLLSTYAARVRDAWQGRLFSLSIRPDDAALGQKLDELLRGGLLNRADTVRAALDVAGKLQTDSREWQDVGEIHRMRTAIANYGEMLVNGLKQKLAAGTTGSTMQDALRVLYQRSRNAHYGSRVMALGGTMAALGWLIPTVQNGMTRWLTGKNKNPGIAHAMSQHGGALSAIKPPMASVASRLPWPSVAWPAPQNHFQSARTMTPQNAPYGNP